MYIDNVFEQRRWSLEEVTLFKDAVYLVRATIFRQETTTTILIVHHLMQAIRITWVTSQDKSSNARLLNNHLMVLPSNGNCQLCGSFRSAIIRLRNKLQTMFFLDNLHPLWLLILCKVIGSSIQLQVDSCRTTCLWQNYLTIV